MGQGPAGEHRPGQFRRDHLGFFLDRDVAFEAFKGDRYDFRIENTAKTWATGYDFPAVKRGEVIKEEIKTKNAEAMQCFVFNGRRPRFQDPRVRLAFNYAFDFEWANTNLFYGDYTRTASFFANSELAATGLPSPEEIAMLEPVQGPDSAGGLCDRVQEPGKQGCKGAARQSAQGRDTVCRGGLDGSAGRPEERIEERRG